MTTTQALASLKKNPKSIDRIIEKLRMHQDAMSQYRRRCIEMSDEQFAGFSEIMVLIKTVQIGDREAFIFGYKNHNSGTQRPDNFFLRFGLCVYQSEVLSFLNEFVEYQKEEYKLDRNGLRRLSPVDNNPALN